MPFTDSAGLTYNEVAGTLHEIASVKPQTSSSGNEPYIPTVMTDSGQLDALVSGKILTPVQEVKNTTVPIDRLNISQSRFVGKTPELDTSLGNGNIYLSHVGLGSDVASGTSLSVERKAECLDLQSLVKDLETRNQKLSEENEKLLNKLSVQGKVCIIFFN
jgi:hypothetical protein